MITPFVNIETPMSADMMHALNMFEVRATCRGKTETTEGEITEWLDEFRPELTPSFRPEMMLIDPDS